jgi:DNA-binding XRE family transcriptional regulator
MRLPSRGEQFGMDFPSDEFRTAWRNAHTRGASCSVLLLLRVLSLKLLGMALRKNVSHRRCNSSYASGYRAPMKKRRAKEDIRERFGFAVKLRREELSLTQEDLAGKAGIHRTYLSDIERGSRNVSLINIERLGVALSLSLSELFRLVEQS